MAAKKGLLIQDGRGDLYFVRPEVLAFTKIPKSLRNDAMTAANSGLGHDSNFKVIGELKLVPADPRDKKKLSALAKEGLAVLPKAPTGKFVKLHPGISRRGIAVASGSGGGGTSTIMCPW